MNRRDMIKTAAATLLVAATASQAEATTAHYNRKEMKPKDPKNLTKGEQKHTPEMTLGGKDAQGYRLVEITVGSNGVVHPSTKGHWIDTIELYADDKLVGKTTLEGEISRGAAAFRVKLDGVKKLTAKAACNLHGVWSSTKSL